MARGLLQESGSEVSDKIGAFLMAATVAAQPKAELVTDIADMAVAALSRNTVSICLQSLKQPSLERAYLVLLE